MTERASADAPAPPATPLMKALADDPRGDVELAHALGVATYTIYRWKTGKSTPRSQAMRRTIALALGFKVNDLWPSKRAAA